MTKPKKTSTQDTIEEGVAPGEAMLAAIRKAMEECDGHSVMRPEFFVNDCGLPPLLVKGVTRYHRSDGTPKGTIFNGQGEALYGLRGVYGLDMLWALARIINADTSGCCALGRGFLARQIQNAIRIRLDDLSGKGPLVGSVPLSEVQAKGSLSARAHVKHLKRAKL